MHIKSVVAAAAMLAAGLFTAADATPISYILTGTFDGSINGTSVTGASFNWTITADTNAIGPFFIPGVFAAPAITDTITVPGFPVMTPTGGGGFIFGPGYAIDGLAGNVFGNGIFFGANQLFGYNGRTAIGPIPVTLVNANAVPTDQGDFIAGPISLTFQVTGGDVPEPLTLALVGAGLAGMGALRRRKQNV